MRWFERTALTLIGALIGGAYLLGTEAGATWLLQAPIDQAFHDVYYVSVHQSFMYELLLVLTIGAAVFGGILWLGGATVRLIASVAVVTWGAGICFAVLPQHFASLAGMPRRYIDASDQIFTRIHLANIASLLAFLCAALLIMLLVIAVVQRLRNRGTTQA